MEDAHICNENLDGNGMGLFAIFDGHGGIEAAKFFKVDWTPICQLSTLGCSNNGKRDLLSCLVVSKTPFLKLLLNF